MPSSVNEDVSSTLSDLEEQFPIFEQSSTQVDRTKWEGDMERVINRRETRLWRKSITSSRLMEFLKVPGAPSIWSGMKGIPKDIWDTTLTQTKGFNGLLELFDSCWPGKNRFFRSIYQFMQFSLMLCGQLHCLMILPTGSGKTLPVALYAKWLQTNLGQVRGHIIVLLPYVLLYGQLKQVMEEASISFIHWELGSRLGTHGAATVIAVSLEHSVRPEFWADMSPLLVEGRIKGMVIDEAHAAIDDKSFRSSFQCLGPRLSTLPAPVWLLTATCPPKYEDQLWSSLGIYKTLGTTITLRQQQENKDILFRLVLLPSQDTKDTPFIEACASTILTTWLKDPTFNPIENGKVLVLTHYKKDVEEVAKILEVDYIHGGVSRDKRERILHEFQNGVSGHPALVANKSCYYGMDIGCISTVIFIGLPDSLLSLQQAAGRAGRRGQPVTCLIVLPPSNKEDGIFPDMLTQVDFAGQSLVPLLAHGTCVDGLLQAFFDGDWIPCKRNAHHAIRCNRAGYWPYEDPPSPQDWQIVPPPIRVTPPRPNWITSGRLMPPPPLSSLAPALVKEREINLLRNHHTHLWKMSLLQIPKGASNPVKCLYCICKGKETKNTVHTWFNCFPIDSKLKNYEFWEKKVVRTKVVLAHGRSVYKPKGAWKHHYLPVFKTSSEEDSQQLSYKSKENLRQPLSAVCGKCQGPVWEEEFHEPINDSYGPCLHKDLILEAIFVLWAEMEIRGDFLKYLKINDPTFILHPDDPKGGQFAEWLCSESEVRGWCNAALWAVPWFMFVYQKGEVGREKYSIAINRMIVLI